MQINLKEKSLIWAYIKIVIIQVSQKEIVLGQNKLILLIVLNKYDLNRVFLENQINNCRIQI